MVRRIATVDQDGFIVVDEQHATNIPGLFAAGDVSTRFSEQIVVALGDGARAAISAYDYLLGR
jgi:alkyl hydroperoxide reductase subunit F